MDSTEGKAFFDSDGDEMLGLKDIEPLADLAGREALLNSDGDDSMPELKDFSDSDKDW